jgi:hypothetical protein
MKIYEVPQEILQLVSAANAPNFDWPEPEVPSHSLSPVPKFKSKMLPKVLRTRVYDIAWRMQCPVDFVAAPMMIMLGSIIGSRCAIRPKQRDDWSEHPNIWGAVIAPPGHLKTPATSQVFAHFNLLERNAKQQFDLERVSCTATKLGNGAAYKALQNQLVFKAGVPHPANNGIFQQMAQLKHQDEDEPTLKRYRTNDATVEKLAELCSENPQGLLVMRDELVGLLASCVKEGHEGERAFYLEGWNGSGKFQQDRIGRGSIFVERVCISVFGTIQPVRLQDFMYGMSGMQNDGLLQRFQVMVYPDKPPKSKIIDEAPDEPAKGAIDQLMLKLADFDPVAWGAQQGTGHEAPFFRFHPSAQTLFNSWLEALAEKIDTEDSPLMAEHLSKYRKLIPAITLIQHILGIIECGRPTPLIASYHLERAIKWSDYLEAHARRVFGQAVDYRVAAAQALMKKIKGGMVQDGFSERDIYRAGWSQLDSPEVVHDACIELVAAGWISPVGRVAKTKPRSPSYRINPKISSKCA